MRLYMYVVSTFIIQVFQMENNFYFQCIQCPNIDIEAQVQYPSYDREMFMSLVDSIPV